MASFKRFEDIQAWQRARLVTRRVYEIIGQGNFAKDYGLREQIRRASVSIMANIAEGLGRRSDKDFANFLNMTHGSTAEVQSHLYIALDLNYIEQVSFNELYNSLDEISRMTLALGKHLNKSKQDSLQTL
jgi:four helix bundle protein